MTVNSPNCPLAGDRIGPNAFDDVHVVRGDYRDDPVPTENEEGMPDFLEYRRGWLLQRAVSASVTVAFEEGEEFELGPKESVSTSFSLRVNEEGSFRVIAFLPPYDLGDAFSPSDRRYGRFSMNWPLQIQVESKP